ncbi:hypothetical protein [Bradyrhizobium diazoefficiens]|nr:hypothetical protein XF15B_59030 [Bradyrhizobium diazoefficiens]
MKIALLMFPLLLTTVAAKAAGGPILRVGQAAGLPGCKVFFVPDGRQWRAQRRDISAGGKCPSDYMSGRLISRNQVRLANGVVCTFDETGSGTCR